VKFIYLTDSNGRKSATLTFVTLSWVAATYQLLFGGASLGEYAAAISGFLIAWLAREHIKRGIGSG